jgi:hypothetical protein
MASPETSLISLSEDGMKSALIEARGDLFVASQMLGVTALRLDRAVRLSQDLQAVYLSLRDIRQENTEFEKMAVDDLERAVQHRLALYRVSGLDALHDLATMPIDDNSAQNQVKLAAAARLAGPTEGLTGGGEVGETLRALNDLYHQNAPRIRIVRERMTVELAPGEREIPPSDLLPQPSE